MNKLKSILIILLVIFVCQNNHAASFIYPNSISPESNIVNNKSDYLKASVFVKLSPKEFTLLTGKKLNFLEKLYFKTVQRKLSREVKKNPDLLVTQYYDQKKAKFKIDPLWFVVGAILGPLGILFAFTSKQPKKFRTSAAIGCILFVLWFGLLFVF